MVLWNLAQSIQQSEMCLFGKLLNFVEKQWETVAFSPGAVTLSLLPQLSHFGGFVQVKQNMKTSRLLWFTQFGVMGDTSVQ